MALTIKKATELQLGNVMVLIKDLDLLEEGISENFDNFFVMEDNDQIIGVAGLEIYNNKGLIRSVGVNPSYQGQGIGIKLVTKIHEFAMEKKIDEIYLLTDTAENFFTKFNYIPIPRDDVNKSVQQSEEFKTQTCASAVVMVKKL